METPRVVLLVFILIFIFVSPNTQAPSLTHQYDLEQLIVEERYAVDLLSNSHYGDLDVGRNRWLNVTGFRQEDGYAWELLPKIQERARELSQKILDTWKSSTISPKASTVILEGETPDALQNASTSSWAHSLETPPMYQNITGIIRGQWARSRVGEATLAPTLNLTALSPRIAYATNEYTRNITGSVGDLQIWLDEKKGESLLSDQGSVREVRADLTIKDDKSTGDGYEMALHGVHYPQEGAVVLSTTSQRFSGVFALPQFAPSEVAFSLAQQLLNKTLANTITQQESSLDIAALNPWSSSPHSPSDMTFPIPHCEYIVYLQQHPTDLTDTELRSIEEELRFPTGASLPTAPPLKMSALLFSPDCGFVLESKGPPDYGPQVEMHLTGPKIESYLGLAKRCILAFAIVICAEISLLMRQMKDTSTPSTRSRVSFYTVAMMAMGDGFACMGFIVVSMLVDSAFLPLTSTAFVAFLCVSFFGMKFLMDIWTVQAPERQERERREAAANPTTATSTAPAPSPPAIITAAGADTLPLPVTASRPADTGATPVILPPDQDIGAAETDDAAATPAATQTTLGSARQEMGALYSRFYVSLLSILFLSLHAMSWPTTIRSLYTNLLAFSYLSFWIPQIYRNVIRNCRKALRWEFVVGQSILRLIPFIYFYTVTDNVLFFKTDMIAFYLLAGWVWIQVWALVSQEILGPRFFVPDGWAPPAYDYHPILHEDDEEAGATMPIGFTQATTESPSSASKPGETSTSSSKGKKTFDCAICMQNIEVPVVPAGGGGDSEGSASSLATTIFSRRAYMVTPCRHIFHSACLEGWMRYRLQCPICRENLPPL